MNDIYHNMSTMCLENFLLSVDVGDDNGAKQLIANVSNDTLKVAYRRTMNNVKNTETAKTQGESPYRSMLEIILDEMNNRGVSPTSGKRSR